MTTRTSPTTHTARVPLYLTRDMKQALAKRALTESVKAGQRISVNALVERWIARELGRAGS